MLRLLATAALALPCSMLQAQGWVDRTPTNPLQTPNPRAYPAMCWDPMHNYVLLFGGVPSAGSFQETWTWNGTAWTRRFTSQPPQAGYQLIHPATVAMAFHPPSNAVVLMYEGSTWLWSGTDWMAHPASLPGGANGTPGNVAMAVDPVSNQLVLYVGTRWSSGSGFQVVSQTFTWDGVAFAWTQRPTAVVPWPAERPTLAVDPVAGRLVLGTNGPTSCSFYEWTGANWQQRLPAGAPNATGSFATDSAHQRLVMFDGVMNSQPNHTWTLAAGAVQQVATPVEPARRFGAAMAFDPVRQRVVLFGGAVQWNYPISQFFMLGDTWEFDMPAGASFTTYGAGCLGSRGVPTLDSSFGSLPRVGQTFAVAVTNLPLQAWTFMFLGTSDTSYGPLTLPLSLGFIGAPGCSLLASGDDLGLVTNVLGTGLWQWPVPNAPGFSFFTQAFSFDAPANPLGITTSNAGHGVIGF
jgi:hypothetical protein